MQPSPTTTTPTLLTPLRAFFATESASGIVLLACTILALSLANSPLSSSYTHLWHTDLALSLGPYALSQSLHHWINDGLMAVFFFVVGLEIKRETLVGELSSPRHAALPLMGALGGMLLPALLYVSLIAYFGPRDALRGWAVPTATDIAFALGVLTLLGRRAPAGLKVFLTALAIADDLAAVLVIAFFYTSHISLPALACAAALLLALIALNLLGIRRTTPYLLLGLALWLAVLKSGVHATVAGVLLAMTIPARRSLDLPSFLSHAHHTLATLSSAPTQAPSPGIAIPGSSLPLKSQISNSESPPSTPSPVTPGDRRGEPPAPRPPQSPDVSSIARAMGDPPMSSPSSILHPPSSSSPPPTPHDALSELESLCHESTSPMLRLEHALHPWVAFAIMPLFALANAGVPLGTGLASRNPISFATLLALFLGKQLGVFSFAFLAVRLRLAHLPSHTTWRDLYAVSCLCGIGFTMSLFIASLAFPTPAHLDSAKLGILAASLLSALTGSALLLIRRPSKPGAYPR